MKEFAWGILKVARENLENDKELLGTAFVITKDQVQCASMSFADHEEKADLYEALVRYAHTVEAVAVVTCNEAYMGDKFGPEKAATYYPGQLADEGASECIMLTVSGPEIQTWCLEVPYERTGNKIVFGEVVEESGGELGLMHGWASEGPQVQ